MKTNALNSWIASFGLHIIFIAGLAIVWKPQINSTPDPSISVDIISDISSSLGEQTNIDTLSTNIDPAPAPIPATSEEMAILDANTIDALPIPNPSPKPQNQKVESQKVENIEAEKPPLPAPKPSPKTALKPLPQPLPKTLPQSVAKPAPKKIMDELPFQFDLAAATKSSAGVNSGGAKTPKLSKSGIVAKGNEKGGGAKLSSSLNNTIAEQVKPCWAEPADLSNPQSLMIMVQMELLPDGNLAKPPKLVYPASKSGASPSVLVAIDNAMRAAKQCAPYVLPSERYAEWQSFSFNFDPKKLRQK